MTTEIARFNIDVAAAEKFRVLYFSKKLFFVFYGGRGSGKTYEVAQFLVQKIIAEKGKDQRYLCLRESQVDLMSSTKATLWKTIVRMGVEDMFHTSQSSSFITCLHNKCRFEFKGCRNMQEADKLRSVENVRIVWIEECHNLKQEVFEILEPSFRDVEGSIFILTFNPMRKQDFVYQEFVVEPPEHAEVVNINYVDNPYFWENKSLVASMTRAKKFPFKFRRVWLGQPGFIENQLIKPEWWKYYTSQAQAVKVCTGMFITADTAYKTGTMNDYSVIQLWGYNSGLQLYLLDQVRGKWEFPTLVSRMRDFAIKARRISSLLASTLRIYIEDKVSGISLVQTMSRENLNVIAWKPKDYQFPDDKVGRANESALIICTGVVYLPANEVWVSDYVTEMSEFTDEKNAPGFDDQVDASTMGISVWRKRGGGRT